MPSETRALSRRVPFAVKVILAGALLSSCVEDLGSARPHDQPVNAPKEGSFESDLPRAAFDSERSSSDDTFGPFVGGPAGGLAPNGVAAENVGDARVAESAITEADLVQLAGDKLYAMSRALGLAIIDVSDPLQLRLLGNYRELEGTPFELYLRDDVAILMFTRSPDSTGDQAASTSKIVAVDVSDPTLLEAIGTFDVPGSIQDSRLVGDVLYVVGMEDGSCQRCDREVPTISVSSLDVSDPHAIRKIDELRYADTTEAESWRRSVTVASERMYVAGPEYGPSGAVGSTVQVIDISDPSGELLEGAVLQARGEIKSRWQMDEYEGVLRIVSQPGRSSLDTEVPRVQTFEVVSSRELRPLGSVDLVIPERDTLRSARFDGTRAYVITALEDDPLITVDLSDPANPRQAGELHIPGFVHHMEPRGDRVLGLGYDRGNPEGSIAVSLFDVSDLATPRMLSRVNFGGALDDLPEDQDRIHKAFRVLTDLNLLLVPFGGDLRAHPAQCSASTGGVQLVDYFADRDELALRGSATTSAQVRRALVHRDHLLAIGDESVVVFDLADRSRPYPVEGLIISSQVEATYQLEDDVVARLVRYDGLRELTVELVAGESAHDPSSHFSRIHLVNELDPSGICDTIIKAESTQVDGSTLYILYNLWSPQRGDQGRRRRGVAVIDANDPTKPRFTPAIIWTAEQSNPHDGYYRYGDVDATSNVAWRGSLLAMLESRYDDQSGYRKELGLRLVDLRDPAEPATTWFPLRPNGRYSGLIADGDRILTSHFEQSSDASWNRARFYVDMFDVSDPSAPVALDPINLPGTLLHYDAASGRALTTQLTRVEAGNMTIAECYDRFAHPEHDYPERFDGSRDTPVNCTGYTQALHLVELREDDAVLEDTFYMPENARVASWSAGDGVVFATFGRGAGYQGDLPVGSACAEGCSAAGVTATPAEPVSLSGFGDGELVVESTMPSQP